MSVARGCGARAVPNIAGVALHAKLSAGGLGGEEDAGGRHPGVCGEAHGVLKEGTPVMSAIITSGRSSESTN